MYGSMKINSYSQEDTQKTEEEIEQYKEIWNRLDILKSLVPWAFVVQIVSSASNILINGSMLYGVTQKKAGFMLPWLIFGMISIVVSISNTLLIEVFVCHRGDTIGTVSRELGQAPMLLVFLTPRQASSSHPRQQMVRLYRVH